MNELDQIEAVAFSVMEADTNLFMLEMMNRHESYRANIAMLALPTIINALIIDCGNELALEVVKRTINKLFG